MNATSQNPYFRPNVCKCGHDISQHTGVGVDTTVTNCRGCGGTAAARNAHIFEHYMAEGPLPPAGSFFLTSALRGYINPGVLGTSFNKTLVVASSKGATLLTLNNTAGVVPGASFFTNPSQVGTTDTYTVTRVTGTVIELDRPLDFNMALGGVLIFDGTHESSMGPGRPSRNYQRMG